MQITPITDENTYKGALKRIEELWDAKADTPEDDELAVLATLADATRDTDATGDDELALTWYQEFKWEFIAKLPQGQPWALHQSTIKEWLAAQANGKTLELGCVHTR